MEQPTVYVIEDDESLAYTLMRYLAAAGIDAVSYASAEDFLAVYDSAQPGCLVVDVRLPGIDGLALQERLSTEDYVPPFVFISGVSTVNDAVRAVKTGAFHFLTKPVDGDAVVELVRQALEANGRNRAAWQRATSATQSLELLTPRERQVLALILGGRTNKEIARELGISNKTVEAHRGKVMLKTGAQNLVELVRICEAGDFASAGPRPSSHPVEVSG